MTPAVLATLAEDPPRTGIFCDFDGSLSPIVPEPSAARPVRGAGTTLARLAARYGSVAIVSGRSVADLARRIRAPGVRLIGLHGMEELRNGIVTVQPAAEAARDAVDGAAAWLRQALHGVRGAILERKGVALAVHFRRAPDPVEAERVASPLVVEAAANAGLAVVPGRRILEVRPMEGGDKGNAVQRLIDEHGLRAAMFGGDDVGDLPAFAALDALPTALRVAIVSPEAPAALTERADLVVGSPKEFVALLRRLI